MQAKQALIAVGLAAGAAFGIGFGIGVFISKRWTQVSGWARSSLPGSSDADIKYGAFRQ
ncbi:MAG: hypothetical protein QF719_09855 [Chloroflexota bacterium]|nr:hypothetical protein [Chloroflexota bacterium]MDP6509433.1 hypothetical protein [Chloroflexota bacterium]MDP6758489.1 hypothetical protein [Chloroflexota bacterium]